MTFALRDAQPTVMHVDTEVIRAAVGLEELFILPMVTIKACYAVPAASPSTRPPRESSLITDDLNGNTETEDQSLWIVGLALEEARADPQWEEKYDLRWPFRSTDMDEDWNGREFVLSHLLSLLNIRVSTNTSPLLLIPPPSPSSLSLPAQALYTQFAFERIKVTVFSILPSPLAAMFALGATTGIVLHVSRYTSEISIIVDSIVRWECCVSVQVGQADCEAWFARLLMGDEDLDRELRQAAEVGDWELGQKERMVKELAGVVWRDCTGDDIEIPIAKVGSKKFVKATAAVQDDEGDFDVARKLVGDGPQIPTATSHKSKKQQSAIAAKAAADAAAAEAAVQADIITLSIPSLPAKEIALGPVRHRLLEPVLAGKVQGGESVWEGMGRAIESSSLNSAERMAIWDGVGVIGEVARIRSFAPALMTYLAPYLLSSPDLPSEIQPAKVRLLSIPDYFTNYKNATCDLAPFLGGSMVAKMAFSDSVEKYCVTKVDYNARGPTAIYAVASEDDH